MNLDAKNSSTLLVHQIFSQSPVLEINESFLKGHDEYFDK